MADSNIVVDINFQARIENLEAEMKKAQTKIVEINKNIVKSIEILNNEQYNLTKKRLEDELKAEEAKLKKLEKAHNDTQKKIGDAQLARLTKQNAEQDKLEKQQASETAKTKAILLKKIQDLEIRHATETRSIYKKSQAEQIAYLKQGTVETKAELDKRFAEIKRQQLQADADFKKMSRGATGVLSGDTGTTFTHKFLTTAQYAAAGAGIIAVTQALSSAVKESMLFDDAIYNNIAVLKANRQQAEDLAKSNRDLSITYGGTIKEIDDLSLTLGRAGVKFDDIKEATEGAVQLAKITGDSFGDSAKVMSTFITTFITNNKEAGVSVGDLTDKLAYMANESKLSVQDLGTFSNYALQTATSLGLTINAVGALGTTFSQLGMNASTIGTQIRKLDVLFTGSAKSITNFWTQIGISQQDGLTSLRNDSEQA